MSKFQIVKSPPPTTWLSIFNHKGGVGKTTLATNLAAYHAIQGHYALLIDADAQANATRGFGLDPASPGLGEILAGEASLPALVQEAPQVPGLHILPAGKDRLKALFGEDADPSPQKSASEFSQHLKFSFQELELRAQASGGHFDLVILDLPPSFSPLSHMGLNASDWVLVPLQAQQFSMDGLTDLLAELEVKRATTNPQIRLAGTIITHYRKNDSQKHFVGELMALKATLQDRLFDTIIPLNQATADAVSWGKPVILYDPDGVGARAYRKAYRELIAIFEKEPAHETT